MYFVFIFILMFHSLFRNISAAKGGKSVSRNRLNYMLIVLKVSTTLFSQCTTDSSAASGLTAAKVKRNDLCFWPNELGLGARPGY